MKKELSTIPDLNPERVFRMRIPALQRIHRALFGGDCAVLHILYMRRKLAWELQARAAGGGLDAALRQHALAIAWQTTLRTRAPAQTSPHRISTAAFGHDTRLPPPGTVLRRQFKGKPVLVKVLTAGFEYEHEFFASLSSVANKVTGGNWNGFVFFGLAGGARHGR